MTMTGGVLRWVGPRTVSARACWLASLLLLLKSTRARGVSVCLHTPHSTSPHEGLCILCTHKRTNWHQRTKRLPLRLHADAVSRSRAEKTDVRSQRKEGRSAHKGGCVPWEPWCWAFDVWCQLVTVKLARQWHGHLFLMPVWHGGVTLACSVWVPFAQALVLTTAHRCVVSMADHRPSWLDVGTRIEVQWDIVTDEDEQPFVECVPLLAQSKCRRCVGQPRTGHAQPVSLSAPLVPCASS